MAASSYLFNKYIWLADLIYSSGTISRDEIDRRWSTCSLNERHEKSIPKRTFLRWKQEIEDLFQIFIGCKRGVPACYYIENANEIAQSQTKQWLLNTFAVTNLINENKNIQDRILLEDMPSDSRFLTSIMESIRSQRVLEVTYKKFGDAEPHSFTMLPYCVKAFKQRWYMVGKSSDHPDEIRVYALDRIHDMKILDDHYDIPEDFDGKEYFRNFYGIYKGGAEPQRILIQIKAAGANYLRSLPLHHSQKEIEQTNEYSIFEFYLAPTFDFIQELRTHGSNLKVLEPQWLAMEFRKLGWEYTLMYPKEE